MSGVSWYVCPAGHVTSAGAHGRVYRRCRRIMAPADPVEVEREPRSGRFVRECREQAARLAPAARALTALAGLEVGGDREVKWVPAMNGRGEYVNETSMVKPVKLDPDAYARGLAVLRELGWPEDGPWRSGYGGSR